MTSAPCTLLIGTDRRQVHLWLSDIRAGFEPDAIDQFVAAMTTAEDVIASCTMPSLLAAQRLVVVQGVDDWTADQSAELLAYLGAPEPSCTLVMTATKLAAASKLRKAVQKAGDVRVADAPSKPAELAAWVQQAFAANGQTVSSQVARRLVDRCGSDSLDRLQSEVDLITCWAGGEAIDVAAIELLVDQRVEEKVWALTDAWATRDRGALLRFSHQLLQQKEHPVRLSLLLARHVSQVHAARLMLGSPRGGGGLPASAVIGRLVDSGANKWGAQKVVQQAQRISMPQADAALARVARLEADLKGGSVLAGSPQGATTAFLQAVAELV